MSRKKLIEVALPLKKINLECVREKSIRQGHPSSLHLWWARRPLGACRAVLFASYVNDPDDDPMYGIDSEIASTERARLFDLIEELVTWENSANSRVIGRARQEIARSVAADLVDIRRLTEHAKLVAESKTLPHGRSYRGGQPSEYTPHEIKHKLADSQQILHFLYHFAPAVLDPFAGGGSIPLEAQRLGLRSYASDLNPVPLLLNKALAEFPPQFANLPPVNPDSRVGRVTADGWQGAEGLADDVLYYGKWIREQAKSQLQHLYPSVTVTDAMAATNPKLQSEVGNSITVVAWLWARTVQCPNPACGKRMPMLTSFWLSKKKGNECYVVPDTKADKLCFRIVQGTDGDVPEPTSTRSMARCVYCGTVMKKSQLREVATQYGVEHIPVAAVLNTKSGRVYVEGVKFGTSNIPSFDLPEIDQLITNDKRWFSPPLYGLPSFSDLFTERQLAFLATLCALIPDALKKVKGDCDAATGDRVTDEYAEAVTTYLGLAISRCAGANCTLAIWSTSRDQSINAFGRQAMPMTWDFPEINPFSGAAGDPLQSFTSLEKIIRRLPAAVPTIISQQDARSASIAGGGTAAICTDPPYYDNIGYADLSDFFYVWIRRALAHVYPQELTTLLTPKTEELIASPNRHAGGAKAAKSYFEKGLGETLNNFAKIADSSIPVTIFYAFKQSEITSEGQASTGWETFLAAVLGAGFSIVGTWPVRTERDQGLKTGTNVLASSIVLVCRLRAETAERVSRREFRAALKAELPDALRLLQQSNIAPVDLAQAAIGPGIGVFSRYLEVLEQDGSRMSVRTSLGIINEVLDEVLTEQEGEFDNDTRFALKWFEQYAHDQGSFGDANTLANALAIGINGLQEAGIVVAQSGKVKLIARDDLASDWTPASDVRLTLWECVQQLIRRLEVDGESGAAELLHEIVRVRGSDYGECARDLAYRLYSTCERKSWPAEALSYNGLVVSWPEIAKLAREMKSSGPTATQQEMFDS